MFSVPFETNHTTVDCQSIPLMCSCARAWTHNMREKESKKNVRSITHRNCWSIFFVWKREEEYTYTCVCGWCVYVNVVTTHSISLFFTRFEGTNTTRIIWWWLFSRLILILLVISFVSLRLFFLPCSLSFALLILSIAFWFYYLPWIKEKRTPRSGNAQTSMRPMVNRISISNSQLCMCVL